LAKAAVMALASSKKTKMIFVGVTFSLLSGVQIAGVQIAMIHCSGFSGSELYSLVELRF
jgi:predicted short-subunit dehydrogenase-like oxidoreductase (DUF2520 family)